MNLISLDSSLFTFSLWRAGSIHDLNIPCRYLTIISWEGKRILRQYAVGYCEAERIPCRPKEGQIALMCFTERDSHFWFHLRKKEFDEVFNCLE